MADYLPTHIPLRIAPPTARFLHKGDSLVSVGRTVGLTIAGFALFFVTPALATAGGRDGTIVAVVIENDTFANTDKHYTNGFRAGFSPPPEKTPDWMRRVGERSGLFTDGSEYRAIFTIGQNMYTPRDITRPDPDPDDRPYAGWLYASGGVAGVTDYTHEVLEISLGIIGPESLADETQTIFHDIIGADEPLGWKSQLDTEPALTITYQKGWTAWERQSEGLELAATPHVGGAVGNVFIYANAGLTLKMGRGLRGDAGPPRIQPAIMNPGLMSDHRNAWYVFAGVEGRAVARNIFLDGNTFRDSPSVNSETFVGDLQFGAAYQFERWKISYTHVFRSDEFEAQQDSTSFGAIGVARVF